MSRVLRVPSTVRSSVSEVWRFFRTFVSFFSRHHVCYQKIENKLDSRNNLKKLYSSRDLKHYLRGIFFFFFFSHKLHTLIETFNEILKNVAANL